MVTRKVTAIICASILFVSLTGCNMEGVLLSIVGLDKYNQEIQVKISQADFGSQFTEVLNTASVSSMETLMDEEARGEWGLQEVEVGIDLQLNGSIESIVSIGVGSGAALTLSRENSTAATGVHND